MKKIITPEQFDEWIATAAVGDRCVYFEGLLMRSRAVINPLIPPIPSLISARKAWALHVAGRVSLTQKRISDFNCQYLAQKLS